MAAVPPPPAAAGRGRGGNAPRRGGMAGGGIPQPQLLNLERVPNLAQKFANKIGKTCEGYALIYSVQGTQVTVRSLLSDTGARVTTSEEIPLLEFERRVALSVAPSAAEKLSALERKYELRLNRAFPAQGPASGSDAAIQAWLGTLPFAERRALLMSQRDFASAYPEGFRA